MKIWELDVDVNNYEHITLVDRDWNSFSELFYGKKLLQSWIPIKICAIEHDDKLKKGDTPNLSPGVPVFSINAIEILGQLIAEQVEFLSLQSESEEYSIVNVINLLDCIDYEKAQVKYYPNSIRIMRFVKYAFRPEIVGDEHIFKIVEQPRSPVFVSDDFRKFVLDSSLKGFKFNEVWDSEEEK